jgi:hypothetical protein
MPNLLPWGRNYFPETGLKWLTAHGILPSIGQNS